MAFQKKKSKETPVADYMPLGKSDLKFAVEIPVKHIDESKLVTIEKTGKPVKIGKLKSRKFEDEIIEGSEREIGRTGDAILIITEKPQAALKISSALGNSRKLSENGVPYYELQRGGKKIIIACAVGHLFGLSSTEKGFPIFKIEWTPSYKKNAWTRKYYNALVKLSRKASSFIVATDYDVEGEVIGWNILRFIAKQKDAKRMKFSTLTAPELQKAYDNLLPTIDWGQAVAGETRHFLDWMYGINLSRALMSAIKKAGAFKIMSVGRVQGPALKLIVDKELEIQKFKSEPYWQIFIHLKGHKTELKYEKDIFDVRDSDESLNTPKSNSQGLRGKNLLEGFKNLKGKKGVAKTEKTQRKVVPPFPFDLTSLQREAYRLLGINPAKTLQIAQQLYLAGVISYPRTSSQKIPDSIEPRKILEKLKNRFKETSFARRIKPIEGVKSDPAHPSIYPTGEMMELGGEELKLYSIIVKRFISCFCDDAVVEDKNIEFISEGKRFIAKGLGIKEKGWMNVYPSPTKEVEVEDINGEKIIEKERIEEKETQPPRRYTPASIITELEKRDLGTKATRANIIETLYDRNYIKGQSIEATPLGISLIETLERYSPIIIDEELTRNFEKEMEGMQETKKGQFELEEKTLKEARETIEKISKDFKTKEEKIGKELVSATKENYAREREENTLSSCPICKKGSLRIIFNRKSRRYFIGCSAYPECKTTFSLPPNGLMKPAGKNCEICGFPKMLAIRKGKRPWEFCFNPNCKSNEEWAKKKEQNFEEKEEIKE